MKIEPNPQLADVEALLQLYDLPTQDLSNLDMALFLGCFSDRKLVAVIGLEVYDDAALLRSLAVSAELKNQGMGKLLVEKLEAHARQQNVAVLYLLTETAETYFLGLGYIQIQRDLAPDSIKNTREFSDLCADSAVLMQKIL